LLGELPIQALEATGEAVELLARACVRGTGQQGDCDKQPAMCADHGRQSLEWVAQVCKEEAEQALRPSSARNGISHRRRTPGGRAALEVKMAGGNRTDSGPWPGRSRLQRSLEERLQPRLGRLDATDFGDRG